MRLFFTISFTFLVALLLEILPFPTWAVWFKPNWAELVLIFWILLLPYRIGITLAFLLGLVMDLLMGTLLGQHAAAFVVIAYFILRFHVRIQLFPLWQQSAMIFIMLLLCQTFFSWINGLLGGFRADAWFWLPALTSAILWPWVYSILKNYAKPYRFYKL
jgi:rod shape-determining protein MreD